MGRRLRKEPPPDVRLYRAKFTETLIDHLFEVAKRAVIVAALGYAALAVWGTSESYLVASIGMMLVFVWSHAWYERMRAEHHQTRLYQWVLLLALMWNFAALAMCLFLFIAQHDDWMKALDVLDRTNKSAASASTSGHENL